MLVVGVVVILGAVFVSMNLSGCGTIAGVIVGEVAKSNYKKTHKQCPYCKSWMELDASVCSECRKEYPLNLSIKE